MDPTPLPTPSAALQTQLDAIRPVRMRRPTLTILVFSLLSLGWVALAAAWAHSRQPGGWHAWPPEAGVAAWMWLLLAAAWLLAFVMPVGAALMPPSGSVLPDGVRARRAAWLGVAIALAAGALIGPALSLPVAGSPLPAILGCLRFGLCVAVVPLVLGAIVIRRVALVGRAALGAALGAAAGALGALTLHCECSVGGALHVALGHGATVLVVALVGFGLGAIASHGTNP